MGIRYIYHGTDEATARRALSEGLKPRSKSGRKSHWGKFESHPDLVYLTRFWPGYFALNACGDAPRFGLVEVDLSQVDPDKLYPDEDYVEHAGRERLQYLAGTNLSDRTRFVRERLTDPALDLRRYAFRCLHRMGNVAHLGSIPREAVRRVSIVNYAANPVLMDSIMAPEINAMNAMIMGPWYEKLTAIMFGDPVTVAELVNWDGTAAQLPDDLRTQRTKHAEYLLSHTGLSEVIESGVFPKRDGASVL